MAGLVPAIHVLRCRQDVDARDICAKTRFALLPGHDGECGAGDQQRITLPRRSRAHPSPPSPNPPASAPASPGSSPA
ncbi:hypothetical protein CWO90_18215 [Bradyrhizobium sp. Leo121]|nr:hypothetical protein CWO90_18215 [Bradyrhizobium sp. Leo121]